MAVEHPSEDCTENTIKDFTILQPVCVMVTFIQHVLGGFRMIKKKKKIFKSYYQSFGMEHFCAKPADLCRQSPKIPNPRPR